ncbi:glycosyltransferase [Candidatus Woesearchaeota archaeon]|nr:glycosyltransferase [Candidatus Woesearchaeota archaeon]
MAENLVMIFGSFIFAGLFAFLSLVLLTVIFSFLRKQEDLSYEPTVSVVIPCYNEEKNISECVKGVYALSYPSEKMEVIIVDDGSTDSTLRNAESLRNLFKDLKILKADHKGKSEALNLGIRNSRNEIVFTVDADTVLERNALKKLTAPFASCKVAATNGSCIANNTTTIWALFQNVEYHYNNLIRKSFSTLFNEGIWFFGAFACYRREILEKVGYFKKDALTEDADMSLELYSEGYKTINVHDAFGYVRVPATFSELLKQRTRWWMGVLQSLWKNKRLFSSKSSPSILFLFINQYWWSFYAVISFPIIAYQVFYWMPYNTETFTMLFMYLFRWFSLLGPVYVVYKLPEWGISIYSIFGVLSGIISAALIIRAIHMFRDRYSFKNAFGIFFYFPYTIILNSITVIGLIKLIFLKRKYFIN